MPFVSRPYTNDDDLTRIQALTAQINAVNGGVGSMHVGDIPHRIFNIMRKFPPGDVVRLWEDADQTLLGWVLLFPHASTCDLQVNPKSPPELEVEMIKWVEQHFEGYIPIDEQKSKPTYFDVLDCEDGLISLLEQRGYVKTHDDCYVLTTRTLDDAIPAPKLPDGFVIRNAEGPHEAGKLGEIHSAAFGSDWTPEAYRRVMASPGYDHQRELVVVAPDGRFAAFCVIWFDDLNRTGLFEPVGAHSDFRRMGLTRALMYAGMQRMRSEGLGTAVVLHGGGNQAAEGLYTGIGFTPKASFHRYTRQ